MSVRPSTASLTEYVPKFSQGRGHDVGSLDAAPQLRPLASLRMLSRPRRVDGTNKPLTVLPVGYTKPPHPPPAPSVDLDSSPSRRRSAKPSRAGWSNAHLSVAVGLILTVLISSAGVAAETLARLRLLCQG